MFRQHDRMGHHGSRWSAGRRRKPEARQGRKLLIEPLEQRQLLAVGNVSGGVLTYTADPGEQNAVVLSPGRFFSIQDAPDVAQFGLGGCVPSQFLNGLNISFSVGFEAFGVSFSFGFGMPLFIDTLLPTGLICPTPLGLGSSNALAQAVGQGIGNAEKGASPAVAGAPVQQNGSIYYQMGAPNGPVDAYKLYQAVVDPASAVNEIAGDDSLVSAMNIPMSTLVNGTFAGESAPGKANDFYAIQPALGQKFSVVIDNHDDNGQTSDGKDKLANTGLTIYDPNGKEVSSAVGCGEATAIGGVTATLPGTYYIGVKDGGLGTGTGYRFVVIPSDSSVTANTSKTLTAANGTAQAIPANGSIDSILAVKTGAVADKITSSTNVQVTLNAAFPDDSALHLSLVDPAGHVVDLVQTGDAAGSNFTDTAFNDGGSMSLSAARISHASHAPWTGTFKPVGTFASTFANDPINGNWKLHVDNAGGSVGTLNNWSLACTVTSDAVAGTANPISANQYGVGNATPALASSQAVDYYKVSGASAGQLVFAVADTSNPNNTNEEASLKVFGSDGTTLLPNGTGVDTGPPMSNQNYSNVQNQLKNAGLVLNAVGPTGITVNLGDGNSSCDASKINLMLGTTTINGGPGADTMLLPGGVDVTANGGAGNDTFVVNPRYSALGKIDGGAGDNNAIQVNGTGGNDVITVRRVGSKLEITVNGVLSLYQVSNIQSLSIDGGGGGDDVVTIDDSGGAISFANGIGITVEGSASQIVFTSGDKVATSNVIQVGPCPSNGTSTIQIGGVTQSVEFNAVNPVVGTLISDSVLGPFEVDGTAASDAITVDSGPAPGSSVLTVENLLAVAYSRKDSVVIHGGPGDDVIDLLTGANDGMTDASITVYGDAGNDTITADPALSLLLDLTLDGGPGNNTLSGGGTLVGGPGNNTFIGSPGNNTFIGGTGVNTIKFQGTAADDIITIFQDDASTLHYSITTGGVTTSQVDTFSNIQSVEVDTDNGTDSVQIGVADTLVATPAASLAFTVIGGDATNARDRLVVQDDGPGDCTIWRQGPDGQSGSITVGPLAPVVYNGIQHVDVTPVDPITDGYGSDGDGRLVVIPPDPFEGDNSRRVAADFSGLLQTHVDPSIDPPINAPAGYPADEDWYRFVAPQTGTFRFQLDFQTIGTLANGRAGLPGDGLLQVTVYDANGNPIPKVATEGDPSHTIGVQNGVTYYVRVVGATPNAVNVYDLELVNVDTFGPQVTGVWITGHDGYNLFTQKLVGAGNVPTPLAYSLTMAIQDLCIRYPGYLYPALDQAIDQTPGHYRLVGDSNGVIPIASVQVINDPVVVGQVATGRIVLGFDKPLPDDRFTLTAYSRDTVTVFSGVLDPAGNPLDGETNAVEPHVSPLFPSGDYVAGGDFAARFTIDSRPEIGVWTAGNVYVDTNGNLQLDPTNADYTNRDFTYALGYTSDSIFCGNFAPTASSTADGFSKLAAYGKVGNTFRWLVDTNNDGVPDINQTDPANVVGVPVAGNFDGNAANGDEVGLFDGKTWYLDGNHNFKVHDSPKDLAINNGMTGYPIAGDFDGDGKTDLATYYNGVFSFDFANNGYGRIDATLDVRPLLGNLYFPGARMVPVAADMDQDGVTDAGLWCPDRAGASSSQLGEWFFLVSNDPNHTLRQTGTVNRLNHPFSPVPPSADLFARMGSQFAMPLVGNFDPPAANGPDNSAVSTTVGSQIVGDGQPGFWSSSSTTWATGAGLDGSSLVSATANGNKQSQAAWWFSMPAGVYDVSITYTPGSDLTKNLGLDLYDGVGNWIGQTQVNEQVAPSDFTDQGVGWKRLGSFKLTGNAFHISTWNSSADGAIAIDAIQLRAAPVIDDGDAVAGAAGGSFSTAGDWTASTVQGAFGGSRTSGSTAGSGASTAAWTMPVTPGSYEVDVTWQAAGNLSASATYNVYDGATKLGSVTVNQQSAPDDLADQGQNWKSLGSFTVTGTQLTVTLANAAADGQVVADAMRILPADQPTPIVNNGSPGSWSNSAWNTRNTGLYGDSLVSNTADGSKSSQAAWWFPCRPGTTYDVQVTWQPGANLSASVPFDVYNALTWIKQAVVNQQNAPSGVNDHGVTWQSLGLFTMTSNVLHISTWNSPSDGAICADGFRIVPVSAEMAAGTPAANTTAALLQTSQLPPIVAAAEARWAAAGVAPAMIDRLKQTRIVVTDLPAGYLGLTEGNTILLSRDAAGFGWFVDPTPAVDEEFASAGGAVPCGTTGELKAIDPHAVDKIDLVTVVEHEMGHILGLGDLDALMTGRLGVGVRRLP